ncbi:MAG TPA: DUF2478 domain-containing protein, partial [Paracoccaceae bacterium]
LAGAVQSNAPCDASPHCDMDLAVLPDGPVIRISQSLGTASSGCRLDAGALEQAVEEAGRRLAGAEVLIVNKFGKHEAEGRGFRGLVAEALAQGIPVLIGVNNPNHAAFMAFVGDLAEPLPDDVPAIVDWCFAQNTKITA